jgi:hypothetical protein
MGGWVVVVAVVVVGGGLSEAVSMKKGAGRKITHHWRCGGRPLDLKQVR